MNEPRTIPVDRGLPVLGDLLAFRNDRIALQRRLVREHGDACFARVPLRDVLVLSSPELLHEMLVDRDADLEKSPGLRTFGRPLLGNGLLTADQDLHKRQRRLMAPAFAPKRIARYAVTMAEEAERAARALEDGQRVDAAEAMMRLTLKIVGRTLFSTDVAGDASDVGEALTIANHYIVDAVSALVPLPPSWPTRKNLENRRAIERLDRIIYRIVRERRASRKDEGDVLSILLLAQDEDDGGVMTDQQVRDEAMTLFLAGHETTANALSWTFLLLAENPHVYARVREEADRVLGGRTPTAEDLPKMPYSLAVLKEAVRLYPPAYLVARRAERPTRIAGNDLAPGTLVFGNIFGMHHRPEYFEDPERFVPERFLAGQEKHPKGAYLPFGAGPHVCIGNHFALMEAQLVLTIFAQHVVLERDGWGPIVPEPLVTLRPKGGVPMRVRRRAVRTADRDVVAPARADAPAV